MKMTRRTMPGYSAALGALATAVTINAMTWAAPASAVSLAGVIGKSGGSNLVQFVHARRYRHCHGSRRCHGRGEYYRYTPTPFVYVPRFYAPYGDGRAWDYGVYGGHHYGHHDDHHYGGHHGGHDGGHH